MIRAIRARAVREGSDAGLSLIELLAASFISLLMLTLVGGMFVQITRLTANGQSTKNATGIAWTVTNELSNVIRQGTQVATSGTATEGAVIAGSTSTSLILDAYADSTVTAGQATIAPTRVTFTVNASGYLVEQRVVGTLSGGYYGFTGTGVTRTVNGPILTTGTGANALFVYSAGSTTITPGGTGLTAAQASSITAVTINVSVANTIATGSDVVQLTNTITMPNVAIVNGGS